MATFDERNPGAKHWDYDHEDGFVFRVEDSEGSCSGCGVITHWVEVNYEGWFCSEECLRKVDEDFNRTVSGSGG